MAATNKMTHSWKLHLAAASSKAFALVVEAQGQESRRLQAEACKWERHLSSNKNGLIVRVTGPEG